MLGHFWQLATGNFFSSRTNQPHFSEACDARQGARHGCPTSGYVSDTFGLRLGQNLTAPPIITDILKSSCSSSHIGVRRISRTAREMTRDLVGQLDRSCVTCDCVLCECECECEGEFGRFGLRASRMLVGLLRGWCQKYPSGSWVTTNHTIRYAKCVSERGR